MLLAHQFALKPQSKRTVREHAQLSGGAQRLQDTHRDASLSWDSRHSLLPLKTHRSLLSRGSPWPQLSLGARPSLWS